MEHEQSAVSFDRVRFAYPGGSDVLHGVSFSLPMRSFTVVVGPSGSGKSTVLDLAAGLTKPTAGKVERALRTRMVFQSGALLPWLTALDNVLLGLADRPKLGREAKERRAREALRELGIEAFSRHYPRDLSGGQRQRVGIARALVAEPELLLLDEPFSALDADTTAHLSAEVEALYQKKEMSMLMVSHSIEDAVLLADEILVVAGGRLAERIVVPLPRPRRRDDARVAALIERVKGLLHS
jgi:ABC-type nitrate/sulfonate/bicarbonate transport system ATPase subunit